MSLNTDKVLSHVQLHNYYFYWKSRWKSQSILSIIEIVYIVTFYVNWIMHRLLFSIVKSKVWDWSLDI